MSSPVVGAPSRAISLESEEESIRDAACLRRRDSAQVKQTFRELAAVPCTPLGGGRLPVYTVRIIPQEIGNVNVYDRQGKKLQTVRKLRAGKEAAWTSDVIDILGGKMGRARDIDFCHEKLDSFSRCDHIEFPDKMRQNIIRFFRDNPPSNTWQCSDFANVVHGKFDDVARRTFNYAAWNYTPLKDQELKNGDTIYMKKRYQSLSGYHFAVLLSKEKGHWISKFGSGGGLSISTLEELKKAYAPDEIFLISPQSEE
ncbi:MAG: hypothetical protein KBC64_00875 [Simkaniaceae bacterium]|nr:hypothetical protein [Simkaniaceae bacterium]